MWLAVVIHVGWMIGRDAAASWESLLDLPEVWEEDLKRVCPSAFWW